MNTQATTVTMTADAEQPLLEACARGDRRAFETLFRNYFGRVHRLAWALIGDRDAALDAAQNAFLKLYRHADRVDPRRPLFPWLRAIVIRECRMQQRGERRRRAREERVARQAVPHASAADPVAAREAAERVARALSELPSAERELIVLKHLEELRYVEIAATLGIPAGTVMSRLYQARRKLREILVRLGAEELR
ncbi:MAG: RNA polymerase sigma factor [Candidatus Latescibacterota bacterium]|nr:MAG: RNA polymerase sigma factor [Candidatus Latescibacterota bacterium]